MGASQDLEREGTRRMLVNAAYWALGMEDKIPSKSVVDIVGEFKPLPFKFGGSPAREQNGAPLFEQLVPVLAGSPGSLSVGLASSLGWRGRS